MVDSLKTPSTCGLDGPPPAVRCQAHTALDKVTMVELRPNRGLVRRGGKRPFAALKCAELGLISPGSEVKNEQAATNVTGLLHAHCTKWRSANACPEPDLRNF